MRMPAMNMSNTYLLEREHTLESVLETWRPVVGFEGRYEVSDIGRVRSLNYGRTKGLVVVMKQHLDRGGYACINFSSLNFRVHSLVMEAFVGPRPEKHDVNHKNGIKDDNRLENLEYVTESQNTQHSFDLGLQVAKRGLDHYKCKFTDQQIMEIHRRANAGESQRVLAQEFGTKQQFVSHVKLGLKRSYLFRKEGY